MEGGREGAAGRVDEELGKGEVWWWWRECAVVGRERVARAFSARPRDTGMAEEG